MKQAQLFLRKGKGKGRGKGKGFPIGHAFPAKGLPARALAGGKGKAGNPRDPSGAVLRCHRCGSESHMIAECPQGKGKGCKKGKGRSYWEESEGWEEGDYVEQYEFTYMQYTDELYGPRQCPVQPSDMTTSFPAIPDTEATEQGPPAPCRDSS